MTAPWPGVVHMLGHPYMQHAFLAGTARAPRLHLSTATAASLGASDGDTVSVSTPRGSLSLPLVVADLPDDVVWLPTSTAGAHVRIDLAAAHGDVVTLSKEGA